MFTKWVVCTKCDTLYSYKDSFKMVNGKKVSKKCSFVPYPNHPNSKGRLRCGARLLDKNVSSNGKKTLLNPRKIYCQRDIKDSLQMLLMQPGFKGLLYHPRDLNSSRFALNRGQKRFF